MAQDNWMIYGANGFTGQLLAERAVAEGHRPVLAGRTEARIKPIAEKLGLPYRIACVDQPRQLEAALADMSLVLHCAGPFSATSAPMVDACLKTQTHYLDITGEICIFEAIRKRHAQAVEAGVSLIPGVGFDIVPTDCLAASLHETFKAKHLGDADRLELAFHGSGAMSPGTAKTIVEILAAGSKIRSGGEITNVPVGWRQKSIPFADETLWCMDLPWGDVSTAYYSTGIPNIVVYTAVPRGSALTAALVGPVMKILNIGAVQKFAKRRIEKTFFGPDEQTRNESYLTLWARIENADGEGVEATLDTPEGYRFTTYSAFEATKRVLAETVATGVLTPSIAFGANFVTQLEGVGPITNTG